MNDINIQLNNVVGSCHCCCEIDLSHLARNILNVEFNPKRFAAAIVRIREPRTTALIFRTGKIIVVGAKNVDQCALASRKFIRIIQRVGFTAKFEDFYIQNIASSATIPFKIDLREMALVHRPFAQFEPELFPGLIYRFVHERTVALVFDSGKIVVTGAKDVNSINRSFRQLYPIVRQFRKW